jgi:hypothetical protein
MLASKDDITKTKEILKMGMMEVLLYLSYRLDKIDRESGRQKNAIQ